MSDEYTLDIKREWLFENAWERKADSQPIAKQSEYLSMQAPRRSKRSELHLAMVIAACLDQELVIITPDTPLEVR